MTGLRVWDIGSGTEVIPPFKGHEDWVYSAVFSASVAFSSDGTRIIATSKDKIWIWDATTGIPYDVKSDLHSCIHAMIAIDKDG
jgi:WD40 repeat protein